MQSDMRVLCSSTYTKVRSGPALSANCIRALFVRCASYMKRNMKTEPLRGIDLFSGEIVLSKLL